VLDVVEKLSAPTQTLIVPTGLTTKNLNAAFAGKADVYVGSTALPYYLTPAANPRDAASVLTRFWTAAGPSPVPGIDASSRNLTMFNPTPAKVADVTIPIVVTIPNATSACPGKPTAGWPVVIVQHGITGNRSQALTMADAYADALLRPGRQGHAAARHHGHDVRPPVLRTDQAAVHRRLGAHLQRRSRQQHERRGDTRRQ
jgi:hypothetical protein